MNTDSQVLSSREGKWGVVHHSKLLVEGHDGYRMRRGTGWGLIIPLQPVFRGWETGVDVREATRWRWSIFKWNIFLREYVREALLENFSKGTFFRETLHKLPYIKDNFQEYFKGSNLSEGPHCKGNIFFKCKISKGHFLSRNVLQENILIVIHFSSWYVFIALNWRCSSDRDTGKQSENKNSRKTNIPRQILAMKV